MKKTFLMVMVLASLAFASVEVTVEKDKYNLAEEISISGRIYSQEISKNWYAEPVLICDGVSTKSLGTSMQFPLAQGAEIYFPDDFNIPNINSFGSSGKCKIRLNIITIDGETVAEGMSEEFEISPELKGDFSISKSSIQMGEPVIISGTIKNLNNEPIEGIFEIKLVGQRDFVVHRGTLENGFFEFTTNFEGTAILNFKDDYNVIITAKDIHGNYKEFTNALNLKVTNIFNVNAEILNDDVFPGREIGIRGTITKDTDGETPPSEGNVILTVEEKTYKTPFTNGKIEYSLKTDYNLKAGNHDIKIKVEDGNGNSGETTISFNSLSVAKSVGIVTDKEAYNPGETVQIKGIINDQAGDELTGEIDFTITNSKGKDIETSIHMAGEYFELYLPKGSPPGEWTISTKHKDLTGINKIKIQEVKDLEILFNEGNVLIRNIGNLKIENECVVNIKGPSKDYSIKKKSTLNANETLTIDLRKEVPTGNYDIETNCNYDDSVKSMKLSAYISGKSYKTSSLLYILLIAFILLGIYYVLFVKKKGKKIKFNKNKKIDRGFEQGKKALERLKKQKSEKKKKFIWDEKDEKDFKENLLKKVRETENKMKESK